MRSAFLRRVEVVSGMLAGLIGLAGLAFAVFGPTYQQVVTATVTSGNGIPMTTTRTETAASLAQQGLEAITIIFLLLMLLAVLGVAAGAYLHARQSAGTGMLVLAVSAGLLGAGVLLSGFSIGMFLLPAAILGIAALVAGSLAPRPADVAGQQR